MENHEIFIAIVIAYFIVNTICNGIKLAKIETIKNKVDGIEKKIDTYKK